MQMQTPFDDEVVRWKRPTGVCEDVQLREVKRERIGRGRVVSEEKSHVDWDPETETGQVRGKGKGKGAGAALSLCHTATPHRTAQDTHHHHHQNHDQQSTTRQILPCQSTPVQGRLPFHAHSLPMLVHSWSTTDPVKVE